MYKELKFDHQYLIYRPFIGMKKAKEFIFKKQHKDLKNQTIDNLSSKIRVGTLYANLAIILVIILAVIDAISIS